MKRWWRNEAEGCRGERDDAVRRANRRGGGGPGPASARGLRRAALLEDQEGRGRRVLRQGGLRRLAHAPSRVGGTTRARRRAPSTQGDDVRSTARLRRQRPTSTRRTARSPADEVSGWPEDHLSGLVEATNDQRRPCGRWRSRPVRSTRCWRKRRRRWRVTPRADGSRRRTASRDVRGRHPRSRGPTVPPEAGRADDAQHGGSGRDRPRPDRGRRIEQPPMPQRQRSDAARRPARRPGQEGDATEAQGLPPTPPPRPAGTAGTKPSAAAPAAAPSGPQARAAQLGRAPTLPAAGAASLVGSAGRCHGDPACSAGAADRAGRGRGGGRGPATIWPGPSTW